MKENKFVVNINRPVEDVFYFTVNPDNTPVWIDDIVREEVNEFPINKGTVYSNIDKQGHWSKYTVTKYERNKTFELKKENSAYHVRYTYKSMAKNKTKLTYFEWIDKGELDAPLTNKTIKKLKERIESKHKVLSKLNAKKKYYLPFIVIIALVIIVSWFYGTYYSAQTSLPCSTTYECIVSYATALFNGYTETLSGLGPNVYGNVILTIAILLALPTVGIVLKYERYLKPVLICIIISQFLFLITYPTLIEPRLTSMPAFAGGLSLFDTFSIIIIATMILTRLYTFLLKFGLIQNKRDFAIIVLPSLIVLTALLFEFLSFGNLSAVGNIAQNGSERWIIDILILPASLVMTYIFYLTYKKQFSNADNINPKINTKFISAMLMSYIFAVSVVLAFLFSSYLLPYFIFYKGGLISIANPHNFGWPIFALIMYICWKKKWLGFGAEF